MGDRNAPDRNWLDQIPTDDADAALQFCRALVRQIDSSAAPTIDRDYENFLNSQLDTSTPRDIETELSVVIPVYNEVDNIPVLYGRLIAVLEGANINFEIVFVDDGSGDESVRRLNELGASDKRVVVIELARNFGHQVAITAGLDFARGRAIAVMDADLQDPPEVLPKFIAKWREGHDVVYAIREHRKEGWLKRTSYQVFYRVLRRVSSIEIPLDAGDFCVMDRRVVDLLKNMPERNRFVRGIRSWVGHNQVGLPFERHARHAGTSKYTVGSLILLALDGLISFSYVPLRVIIGSWTQRFFRVFILGGLLFCQKASLRSQPSRLCEHHRVDFLSGRNPADHVGRDRRVRRPDL